MEISDIPLKVKKQKYNPEHEGILQKCNICILRTGIRSANADNNHPRIRNVQES